MKLKEYLKDRIMEFVLAAAALGVMLLFLYAFHVSMVLTLLIACIFLLFLLAGTVWDYMRKRTFYNKLQENLSAMDQSYLASAVIPKPEFYEGRILYDTIGIMGKAMTEQVSAYRQNVSDFKEYVEMWVHEAKLPIASMLLKQHNMSLFVGTSRLSGADPSQESGAEMLPDGTEGSEQQDAAAEALRQIRKQLLKLDSYTDQILYYTRSEVAEKDFLIKECLLSKLFSNTASRLREELQESGFDIVAENLNIPVLTDGKWLEFILGQLISNSIKYRADDRKPELKVWAKDESDRTEFHLRDNGIGIPEKDLPRIFEKSFTGENGRLREKSTGMGLYIAGKLCSKLGHRISADSSAGVYTEFTIIFAKNDFYKMQP